MLAWGIAPMPFPALGLQVCHRPARVLSFLLRAIYLHYSKFRRHVFLKPHSQDLIPTSKSSSWQLDEPVMQPAPLLHEQTRADTDLGFPVWHIALTMHTQYESTYMWDSFTCWAAHSCSAWVWCPLFNQESINGHPEHRLETSGLRILLKWHHLSHLLRAGTGQFR